MERAPVDECSNLRKASDKIHAILVSCVPVVHLVHTLCILLGEDTVGLQNIWDTEINRSRVSQSL